MLTDTNVLDNLDKAPVTPVEDNTPAALPNFADQLSQIKNGDGAQKYSDVPSALQALGQSQSLCVRAQRLSSTLCRSDVPQPITLTLTQVLLDLGTPPS